MQAARYRRDDSRFHRRVVLSRDPRYLSDLKRLSRESPGIVDAIMGPEYLKASDDRAAAIIVSTHLEDQLKELILSKMIHLTQTEIGELFVGDSPLATFGAKVHLAYALGLIGKLSRQDLNLVRLIRNAFAHARKPIQFNTNEVATACEKLTLPDRYQAIERWKGIEQPMDTPRLRFVATVKLYEIGIMYAIRPELHTLDDDHHPVVPLD